jgi:hypothetical protein
MNPVIEKYKLTAKPGLYHFQGFGEIDLRTLTLDQADNLVKRGFPYLILKKQSFKKLTSDKKNKPKPE